MNALPPAPRSARTIFVTGGTGYVGSRLIPRLAVRGHRVRALVRARSGSRLPTDAEIVTGDALDPGSFAARVAPADTFIQLVGTPHPAPWKGDSFRRVDLAAGRAGVAAARSAGVRHFVYLSVAQPAPVMREYQRVRAIVEAELRALAAAHAMMVTVVRPWYVLGPGHWWPYATVPVYGLMEAFPPTRALALRTGLVTIDQLLATLIGAVEDPAVGVRILDVAAIRAGQRAPSLHAGASR